MGIKQTVLTLALISPLLLLAQNTKVIHIKPLEVATLNLSQVAEKVTPVSLSSYKDFYINGGQYFYITDDYLFIISGNVIAQLDISGKYIKTIRIHGQITGVTGNQDKNEIYFSTKSKIICCDYSLTVKKVFTSKYNTNSIFFYNNKLCIASYKQNEIVKGVKITYKLSSMDVLTGKEKFFHFEISETGQGDKWGLTIREPIFTVYDNQIVYSNNEAVYSNAVKATLYGIKGNNIYPLLQYVIEPNGEDFKYQVSPYHRQGFIGKYLYIEYGISSHVGSFHGKSLIYLEDTETGKAYNLNETFNDDIYHTGSCKLFCFANKQGYFIVRRDASDLKKSANLKIPADSPAIFIVKVK